jgi:hypothetical protein
MKHSINEILENPEKLDKFKKEIIARHFYS